ncbi:hypothetical protein HPP92_018598 [Vanilla planifolia]|uniref:Uncharacterized protein n=1 Tax=Vanilla planifolia TaxID=51239 RepID=A0A835UQT4_VANPL|nr:hypothetical protein HPP92_019193 [Vanilla planifolia]KAG0469270.1 hypothetical protein HPP92_018598 [Vanilla planifolia]
MLSTATRSPEGGQTLNLPLTNLSDIIHGLCRAQHPELAVKPEPGVEEAVEPATQAVRRAGCQVQNPTVIFFIVFVVCSVVKIIGAFAQ